MKKIFLIIAMVAVLVCLFTISAFATEINGVHYTLDNDGTATVNTNNKSATTVDVTIPSEVTYDGVTYKVDALELIDPEDTPKNIILRAIKKKKFDKEKQEELKLEYEKIKKFLLGR